MFGVLVKNIDTLADDIIRSARNVVFQSPQGLDTGLVDVVDGQSLKLARHDVNRQGVEHLVNSGKTGCRLVRKLGHISGIQLVGRLRNFYVS